MEMIMLKDEPLDLSQLESLQTQWQFRQSEAAAEVTRLQGQLGRGIILGGSDDVRPQLAAAQNTIQESELVLAEIAAWIPPAKAAQLQKQAAEFRRQAMEATAMAKDIEEQVVTHLVEIEKLEGVMYVKPPVSPLNGAGLSKSSELRQKAFRLTEKADDKEAVAGEILSKFKINGGNY